MAKKDVVLQVKDLTLAYMTPRGALRAVDHVAVDVYSGEVLGIVGESGCGKSSLAFALIKLLPSSARIESGQIFYGGKDIISGMDGPSLRKFRWQEISMVFQSALNTLNPVMRIGEQIQDVVQAHLRLSQAEIYDKAARLLEWVYLNPTRVWRAYPHELSGGMRQRVAIALSLILDPKVVVLDEPTTALDVISQEIILRILTRIHREMNISMIFITHDLSLVARVAERVAVMYAGKIVEIGTSEEVFYSPRHPYTMGLLKAIPSTVGDLRKLEPIPGSLPDLIEPPPGCRFRPRCNFATKACKKGEPELIRINESHQIACFNWKGAGR
ncbi:MAG TPA: ABC transporter ATP-binding protein [Firmicutes bacterium]|nr:ABC transporter ATP-binding protein [Bacillota bacterium]HHY98862.1 ABC transporter ATP-binding protein [Bacillota bacterium]